MDPTGEDLLKAWFGDELPAEPPENHWRPQPADRHGMVDMVPTTEAIAWAVARSRRRPTEESDR